MSSRAVRKALKKLQEEELKKKLGQPEREEDVESEEEDDAPGPSNPFAMLNEVEASEEEETASTVIESVTFTKKANEQEKSQSSTPTKKSKNKKKKRKGAGDTSVTSTPKEAPSSPAPPAPDVDDVDRAIQEISLKYGESPSPSTSTTTTNLSAKYSLLAVQSKFLDAEQELRKLFGKIVDQEKREKQSIPGVPTRVLNRIKASQKQQKRTLMNPQDDWKLFVDYNKRMLSMDIVEKEGAITKFKFTHSRKYQGFQTDFFIAAFTSRGEQLMQLIQQAPFHVDTCIQVSEMSRQQGSLSEAADLIERALFALDCALHPLFNVTTGTSRLPFVYFENRCFYLAVWLHMESLGRRGCWRTCFEFNKLLFAMEPEENPYAALLAIDYAAMRAREYNYLIELRDSPDWLDETGYLLNLHYSAALAEYMLEKDQKRTHEKSSETLSQTIQRFPWLIAPLFYELKLTFPADFSPTVPPSPLQALYTDLYIYRSKDLWTPPEISTWLTNVAKSTATQVTQPESTQTISQVPLNVARQIFVMSVPSLMGHIPREYTAGAQMSTDPLPPPVSISPYEHLPPYITSPGTPLLIPGEGLPFRLVQVPWAADQRHPVPETEDMEDWLEEGEELEEDEEEEGGDGEPDEGFLTRIRNSVGRVIFRIHQWPDPPELDAEGRLVPPEGWSPVEPEEEGEDDGHGID